MQNLELGCTAKDIVTGFTGVVTGKAEYMTGCVQFSLTPGVDSNGKFQDNQWVDEGRLEVMQDVKLIEVVSSPSINPGGPQHGTMPHA